VAAHPFAMRLRMDGAPGWLYFPRSENPDPSTSSGRAQGHAAFVAAHPSDKNKRVARVGHPELRVMLRRVRGLLG